MDTVGCKGVEWDEEEILGVARLLKVEGLGCLVERKGGYRDAVQTERRMAIERDERS